jgi:predicted ArsR family transcriptional regulator
MNQQLSLTLEPRALARRFDPTTSHIAADRVAEFAGKQHDAILAALRDHGPSTAHEIAAHCGLEAHAVGKRMNELFVVGLVKTVADGKGDVMTRLTPSGRKARVWFLVDCA